MGFPFEIITMLGSTLLSSLLSIWSQSRKAKAEEQKLLITRGEFDMKTRKQALDHSLKDKGFAWTRRIIALTAIFFILCLIGGILSARGIMSNVDGGMKGWFMGIKDNFWPALVDVSTNGGLRKTISVWFMVIGLIFLDLVLPEIKVREIIIYIMK